MSTLSDILGLLDRWPAWKTLTGLPERVAELERRLAKLEGGSGSRPGGVTSPCPICGKAMALKTAVPHRTFGDMGVQERHFECACGHSEDQMYDPNKAGR